MSGAPVDRLTDRGVVLRDLEEALGMPEEQHVPGTLQMRYPGEQLALCVFIEVNHHVPAKDAVQWTLHRQAVHEVELLECNQRHEFGAGLVAGAVAAAALHEKTRQAMWPERAYAVGGINAA